MGILGVKQVGEVVWEEIVTSNLMIFLRVLSLVPVVGSVDLTTFVPFLVENIVEVCRSLMRKRYVLIPHDIWGSLGR